MLKLFYNIGVIFNYYCFQNKNNKKFIKIFPLYYKGIQLSKNFRLISTPSKTFFISCYALTLLQKKSGAGVYIISTHLGLLTHTQAIVLNVGGVLIGFFYS